MHAICNDEFAIKACSLGHRGVGTIRPAARHNSATENACSTMLYAGYPLSVSSVV